MRWTASTVHSRLIMFREGSRHHDFLGWTRESCQWFEMNGIVRRLYISDGLAVNAHEDSYLGNGLDSISISGRGVSAMIDLFDTDVRFFHWGFEVGGSYSGHRLCFHLSDIRSMPTPPSDTLDSGVWDVSEARRLLSLVYFSDDGPVTDDPSIRLGETLTMNVDGGTFGSVESPQADVVYQCGSITLELRGTLTRCREGVAVMVDHDTFLVIALPLELIDEMGGAASRGLGATLRFLNTNLDECCEGRWVEGRPVPTDPGTGGEALSFPFPEGIRRDPKWRDVDSCLCAGSCYDCDLFFVGIFFDWMYVGPKPENELVSFVFKPSGFRIYDWSGSLSSGKMNQPLTEGELRHLMRFCRRYIREHLQEPGDDEE